MRVASYGRYSDKMQNESSVEHQLSSCRRLVEREEGWTLVHEYSDAKISGFSVLTRPGIQQLMQDAKQGKFDVVVAEALDRISRDQEDVAAIFKRLSFMGIPIFTVTEGLITELHIGMKGTMNALFLKDMKIKVKRGQQGELEKGKIVAGLCFGYSVVRRLDEKGKLVTGERVINHDQAEVIRRIFRDYVNGKSPRAIAHALNAEDVQSPSGGGWLPSTIYGTWQRGAGILNNELYAGRFIWNKVSYPKNPETGLHVTRNNPKEEWVQKDFPHLRIIDEELWQKTKQRQLRSRQVHTKYWQHRRPENLFSFLLKCGCCGGGMSKISTFLYGCTTARNKGESQCSNRRNIRQDVLERTVLSVLQKQLMNPELTEMFCNEYRSHLNKLRSEHSSVIKGQRAELAKLEAAERRIVQAVIDGYGSEALKQKSLEIEARKKELQGLVSQGFEAPVLLHPNMAARYHREVARLTSLFHDTKRGGEAKDVIRALIEKIVLTPDPDSEELLINVHGDLAGILNMAAGNRSLANESDLKTIRVMVGLDPPTHKPARKVAAGVASSRSSQFFPLSQEKLVGPGGLEPPTRPL